MSELFDSVIGLEPGISGLSDLDLDSVFGQANAGAGPRSKMDLLSTSLQDSGILRPNNQEEEWLLDHDTDDLLKSMLTGNDLAAGSGGNPQVLLDDINTGVESSFVDYDRQLLSPADSAVSSGSGSNTSSYGTGATATNAIDLMDLFNDDMDDDKSLIQTCVNPHTNSPDEDDYMAAPTTTTLPPPPTKDTKKPAKTTRKQKTAPAAPPATPPQPTQATRVVLKAHRTAQSPRRVASTNVYHHKPVISVVRNGQPATAANITLAPTTAVAAAGTGMAQLSIPASASQSFETGTTTIYLPVLNAKSVQQPTIIRMNPATATATAAAAAATSLVTTTTRPAALPPVLPPPGPGLLKRRRMSASSDDSGQSDDSFMTEGFNVGKPVGGKYPRLHLNDEERKLCEKEGIVLPSHYPLTKEEERNLKRIRRKIRNKQSAQDSRKRKKEHVENMEARAMKCAQENAELVKKLSQLEAQNKTLVGQLRRLHQIIVNKGGISSSNVVAQAAMHQNKGQGQTSTALMVLLLSTALFLIPGMREQLETKPSLDIQQVVKSGPPIVPGQSRSLLQFTGPHVKQEQQHEVVEDTQFANPAAAAAASAAHQTEQIGNNSKNKLSRAGFGDHDYTAGGGSRKRSYVVADAPTLGYGDNRAAATSASKDNYIKQEDQSNGDERRLNISVTGGQSGTTRTVVLTVPKGL